MDGILIIIYYLYMDLVLEHIFFGFITLQISAWLRVFICIDRYISLRYFYRTWRNQSKTILIIIISIVIFFVLFNHTSYNSIFIFNNDLSSDYFFCILSKNGKCNYFTYVG